MRSLFAAVALLLATARPALAHRLDEYLQATTISVSSDRVQAGLRLAPGVAAWPVVRAAIDADANGTITDAELRAYAERVLRDLTLRVDGDRLTLSIDSVTSSSVDELAEGRGEILIAFGADVAPSGGARRLSFENHHMPSIAAYLVNGLVPSDSAISMREQNRNYEQSTYRLDYTQAGVESRPWRGSLLLVAVLYLGAATLLLLSLRAGDERRGTAGGYPQMKWMKRITAELRTADRQRQETL